MKKFGILLIAGTAALVVAGLLRQGVAQTPGAPAATRVAVCDVVAVFNKYERARDLAAKFDERAKQIQAQGEQRQTAIQQAQEQLDALVPGSKEFEARLEGLQKLKMEGTVWLELEKMKISRERLYLTEQMYQEILDAIAEIARQRGFDVVLHRDSAKIASKDNLELLNKIALRKCLYANPAVDLTEAVLERSNQKYRARGK